MSGLVSMSNASSLVKFDGFSFQQQVSIMSQTDLAVSIHGAQLTNIMFIPPGGGVIEIFNPFFKFPNYGYLAEKAELKYVAFRNTTVKEEPIEVRQKWWDPTVNYKVYVMVDALLLTVKGFME